VEDLVGDLQGDGIVYADEQHAGGRLPELPLSFLRGSCLQHYFDCKVILTL
jgi:hypothetical protein